MIELTPFNARKGVPEILIDERLPPELQLRDESWIEASESPFYCGIGPSQARGIELVDSLFLKTVQTNCFFKDICLFRSC